MNQGCMVGSKCIYILMVIIFHHAESDINWQEIGRHEAWKMLNSYDCGLSATDRIIGGVNAALGQFPWLVRIGYKFDDENELDWMCGGALVTDRHVVTAAHCVQTSDEYELSLIRMGEYDTQKNPDCQLRVCAPPVQDRKARSVYVHPKFNKPKYHNDIAVILLDKPVTINDYVVPICIPHGEQPSRHKVGELVTVAGWGKMNMTTEERAKILQFVAVPIVDSSVCDSFGKGYKASETEICAGAQLNKDACGGDSGGPLMKVYDTAEGPKSYIIGVVSFGPTICGIRKPGVYTSVPHFLMWILDRIINK